MSSFAAPIDRRLGPTLLLLVAIAALLRASGIDAKSFWGDEVVSLNLAKGHSWYPWMGEETEAVYSADHYRRLVSLAPGYFGQRLVSLLRIGDQTPPLYFAVLNLWMHAFGTSVAALRSLALVASVATVPVMYGLGRAVASHRVGLYAAAIFAVAPFQVAFGLYNRPYSLLCFFAICSTWAAVHLSRGDAPERWLPVHAATAILGVYTHYLFVWNLIPQLLMVAYYQRRNPPFLKRFVAACAAVAGLSLLWAPTFFEQLRWSRSIGAQSWFYWYSGRPSLADGITSLGRNVLLLLTAGRVQGFCPAPPGNCQIDNAATIVFYGVPLLMIVGCGVRMTQHFLQPARDRRAIPDPWVVCLVWGSAVLAGPVLSDVLLRSHMVSSHRYFIAASGPLYLAVALAMVRISRPSIRRSVAGAGLAFLVAASAMYLRGWSNTLLYEIDTRGVARHVDSRANGGGDLILVLDPGLNPTDFSMYLTTNPDFARIDIPAHRPSASSIPEQLATATQARPVSRIWYVDDLGVEAESHAMALEWLRARYVQLEFTEFTNVGLYVFSPAAAADAPSGPARR